MLMIHCGILTEELDTFEAQTARFGEKHDILLTPVGEFLDDGSRDSWEEWGLIIPTSAGTDVVLEAIAAGGDYSLAQHVTLSTMFPLKSMNFMAQHLSSFLMPMGRVGETQNMRMALTDASDFSQEYVEYRW